MAKKMYVYYQPNKKDLKDEGGDCVIRAFCKVTGMTWLEVFDELYGYAREFQCMPNHKESYESFLKNHGFKYVSIPRKSKMTVKDFRKDYKGLAICNVRVGYGSHFVACDGGQYFDTWDSGDSYVFGYYAKE